ncbi:sporulation peptidase YabG [Paramaledivibacter caminithermalis]|jgi:spore coat assembly protein|uniref:Spore coat assemly protein n=1 Tax=Paramaledivibacter caminithermalis (strain DSM 15212 / CIP 107654 / DViRD3) TaxID=1121301 RepID=A0A1M6KHV4_PARC5|nr:sporulation peptidase YabG [Paramaledivibacter caminithermalis]SHJ58481.1 spore coat assemly protein [Paramaledivibacter caminithermalis DSM 15212]
MTRLKIGDIVARKSYDHDILFKIMDIVEDSNNKRTFILKGTNLRIIADSPEGDLTKVPLNKVDQFNKTFNKRINEIVINILKERKENHYRSLTRSITEYSRESSHFGRPGKVLHLDGDGEYIDVCLKVYKQLDIEAVGKVIPENQQPKVVEKLLKEYNPDILILTGHDSILKGKDDFTNIENYRNSKYFVESVKEARKYESSMDELVIFAGACQSLFEVIIEAGANFASSPHRTLIECRI